MVSIDRPSIRFARIYEGIVVSNQLKKRVLYRRRNLGRNGSEAYVLTNIHSSADFSYEKSTLLF